MPYLNFLCIVLWCQTFIPTHAPTLPPSTANNKSVASEMRHLALFVNAVHDECYCIDGKKITDEATV